MKHLSNRFAAAALLGAVAFLAVSCSSDEETAAPEYPQTAEVSGSIAGVYVGWSGGAMIDSLSAKEASIMLQGEEAGDAYMLHVSLKKDLAVGTFAIPGDAELVHLVLPGMNETTVTAGTIEIMTWDAAKGTAELKVTSEEAKIGGSASEAKGAFGQMTFKVMGPVSDAPAETETETPAEG